MNGPRVIAEAQKASIIRHSEFKIQHSVSQGFAIASAVKLVMAR
jgi:hypothetical protein